MSNTSELSSPSNFSAFRTKGLVGCSIEFSFMDLQKKIVSFGVGTCRFTAILCEVHSNIALQGVRLIQIRSTFLVNVPPDSVTLLV